MNLLGEPAPANEWKATFSRMLIIVITYWLLSGIFAPPGPDFEVNDEGQLVASRGHYPLWKRVIYNVLTTSFGLYTLIILAKLRAAVRKRYDIPQQRCAGLEDLCCAFWCSCCTVSQIARQTADYEQKRAICCSDTGLPATSSAIIV
jgi:Cys-rich protein (TIGR01571 family)